MADRCGRLEASNDSVVNLSAEFLTRIPVEATTGSAIAARRTPPSAAIRMRRPAAFDLLAVQFKICTSLEYAGAFGTTGYEAGPRPLRCRFRHAGCPID